jgi:putative transposon-encoded protein
MFSKDSLLNLAPVLNPLRGQKYPTFMDDVWRQKISKGLAGRKLTEKHKQNMKIALRRATLKYILILFDDLSTIKIKNHTFIHNKNWSKYKTIEVMEIGEPLKLLVSKDTIGEQIYVSSKNIKKIFYKGDLVFKKEKQIVLNEDNLRLYIAM